VVELELRLSGLDEVFRWVMSWGDLVEVLEPTELRERVWKAARSLEARHRSG
jgi:predicted DNA-binding transcriptional regulator YafY